MPRTVPPPHPSSWDSGSIGDALLVKCFFSPHPPPQELPARSRTRPHNPGLDNALKRPQAVLLGLFATKNLLTVCYTSLDS